MKEQINKIEELWQNAKEYINIRIAQAKINLAEKFSSVISKLIAGWMVMALFFAFAFFMSIALALFVGQLLNAYWLGFLIVSFLYLVAAIIVWCFREPLIRVPILNSLLKIFLSHDKKEDDED